MPGTLPGIGSVSEQFLVAIAMIVCCLVPGIIESYISIKLESAIPAAMIHSVVNAGAAFPFLLAKEGYTMLIGPAITGFVGGLPFAVLAVILFIKVGNKLSLSGRFVHSQL